MSHSISSRISPRPNHRIVNTNTNTHTRCCPMLNARPPLLPRPCSPAPDSSPRIPRSCFPSLLPLLLQAFSSWQKNNFIKLRMRALSIFLERVIQNPYVERRRKDKGRGDTRRERHGEREARRERHGGGGHGERESRWSYGRIHVSYSSRFPPFPPLPPPLFRLPRLPPPTYHVSGT